MPPVIAKRGFKGTSMGVAMACMEPITLPCQPDPQNSKHT